MPAQSRQESTAHGGSASSTTTTTAPQTGADNSTVAVSNYTVVSGDSLWKIAQSLLGNGGRYMEIYEANRDSLSSPAAIRVGQNLIIPGAVPVPTPSPSVEEEVLSEVEAGSQEQEEVLEQETSTTVEELPPDENLVEYRSGAAATGGVDLAPGTWLTLTAEHLSGGEARAWETIAKDNGMSEDLLIPFNQHIESVAEGNTEEVGEVVTPSLAAGVRIYIPSAAEILLAQCRKRTKTLTEAVAKYQELAGGSNLKMMEQARLRASGDVGLGYGTSGHNGVFYSQNPELAGASSRRTSELNGGTEYRVNWGVDFWKCSVFLNDVAFSAGYKPDMTDNDHYRLAGQLHWSREWEEVDVSQAAPGHGWQRFGGTGSNESHNAVLSSFVEVEDISEEVEQWTFSIVGAENDRAAESERVHQMKKGTNENTSGKIIRFFKPKYER